MGNKRVIYVPDQLNNNKYILCDEYDGFGIYQRMTPNGYYSHQDWLVYNGKIGYISESYNSRCKEELMDTIDNFNDTGKFGLNGFMAKPEDNIYGEHPNVKRYYF